ncbi:hypothetical protein hrd7_05890 [Leptolinea sp. HRD-7]|nr:hypothetical protein hrd7_05890 [Leptolinea sp. HRD-7]
MGRVVPVANDSVPYDEQPACGLKRFQLRSAGKAGGGVTVFHPQIIPACYAPTEPWVHPRL